jgi:hypothetical protein
MPGFNDAASVSDIVDLYGDCGNAPNYGQSQVEEIFNSNTTAGIFDALFG